MAACLQSYNLCKIIIDKELMNIEKSKPLAVVLDVDETVLDNSPYQAECVIENISYPTRWDEWCNLAIAKPIPGALEFLKYAESKGVSAFYVTNRKDHLKTSTIKNLKDQGFPFADSMHVIMRTQEASKEGRRRAIQEKYNIVILIGDNLSDLSMVFDEKHNDQRIVSVENMPKDFGVNMVIIPNAMYGDWENAIYNAAKIKNTSKIKLRHQALRGF
jgi:5'-nucleotidase (lipoprotein e(P4) family)